MSVPLFLKTLLPLSLINLSKHLNLIGHYKYELVDLYVLYIISPDMPEFRHNLQIICHLDFLLPAIVHVQCL
jgi:hypothetical protein